MWKFLTETLKGHRTFMAVLLTTTFGILATTDWVNFLHNPSAGWTALAMSLLYGYMRMITTTPPFQNEPQDAQEIKTEDKK